MKIRTIFLLLAFLAPPAWSADFRGFFAPRRSLGLVSYSPDWRIRPQRPEYAPLKRGPSPFERTFVVRAAQVFLHPVPVAGLGGLRFRFKIILE